MTLVGESLVTIQETTPRQSTNSPSRTFSTPPSNRNRCCFTFPCFGPAQLTLGGPNPGPTHSSLWDRLRAGESDNKWWARPIKAFKMIREWSEIVAGPKWKTFIRRFNRNNRQRNGGGVNGGKFQYDPLSYALNFDEGHNGHFDGDDEDYVESYPDFSSRFASSSGRSSMDLGKGAPAS